MTCSSLRPLVLLLVAAKALAQDEAPSPPVAIYTSPLAVGEALGLSVLGGSPAMVFIPVGVVFTAGEVEWSVDAAFVYESPGVLSLGYSGLWLSAGPMVHSGRHPLGGLFFVPKVVLGTFQYSLGETMVDVMAGAEIGAHFTVDRFYFAFAIGASVGVGIGDNDNFAGPWTSRSVPFTGAQPVVGFNADVFRIGYTF